MNRSTIVSGWIFSHVTLFIQSLNLFECNLIALVYLAGVRIDRCKQFQRIHYRATSILNPICSFHLIDNNRHMLRFFIFKFTYKILKYYLFKSFKSLTLHLYCECKNNFIKMYEIKRHE